MGAAGMLAMIAPDSCGQLGDGQAPIEILTCQGGLQRKARGGCSKPVTTPTRADPATGRSFDKMSAAVPW
jgi:hypothetical protein